MSLIARQEIELSVAADGGVLLAGLPVFIGNDEELLQEIAGLVLARQTGLVVTANVDQTLDLGCSAELREAYELASIRTLDGTPLVWLSRLLGARNVHRQTGADLLTKCASNSYARGWKVAIVGGEANVNSAAVQRLVSNFPLADIVGIKAPYFKSFHSPVSESIVQDLWREKPDVVFICLGSPKQERFVLELKEQLPPAVYIGAGAAVDFAAGVKRRAPQLIQKAGLEWTWRLLQEPRRLGYRYLVKGAGIASIVYSSIKRKVR